LKAIAKMLQGPRNESMHAIEEIRSREVWVIAPLMALMLLIGIWPASLLNLINYAVNLLF
jgi:NADH-quinone oxidoreductase subunit M